MLDRGGETQSGSMLRQCKHAQVTHVRWSTHCERRARHGLLLAARQAAAAAGCGGRVLRRGVRRRPSRCLRTARASSLRRVMVVSTPEAEEMVQVNNGLTVVDMLRPLGEFRSLSGAAPDALMLGVSREPPPA